jgi:hypothetical protein
VSLIAGGARRSHPVSSGLDYTARLILMARHHALRHGPAFRGGVSAQLPAPASPSIAAVSYPDSPLTITASRILSVKSPAAVAFEVTNFTNRSIGDYGARVYAYAYTANGRPIGSGAFDRAQNCGQGPEHRPRLAWRADSRTRNVVLITITAVTFGDETVWRVPLPDAQGRVKAEAARLIGVAGVEC